MRSAMARHILVKTADEAKALKRRMEKGDNFEQLARKHSQCPSGKRGGDLGEVKKGQMVASVDKAIFSGPLRQVQGPVKSRFGYHLVQVYFRD